MSNNVKQKNKPPIKQKKHTIDVHEKVCNLIAETVPPKEACKQLGVKYGTFRNHNSLKEEHAAYRALYVRAREEETHTLARQALDIAFSADKHTERQARLQFDAIKWAVSKWNPKDYGDKATIDQSTHTHQTLNVNGTPGSNGAESPEAAQKRLLIACRGQLPVKQLQKKSKQSLMCTRDNKEKQQQEDPAVIEAEVVSESNSTQGEGGGGKMDG